MARANILLQQELPSWKPIMLAMELGAREDAQSRAQYANPAAKTTVTASHSGGGAASPVANRVPSAPAIED